MNAKLVLNKIITALGMDIKLEQMTLKNGTVIEAEIFEAGQEAFIVTEDSRVAIPIGEYEFEDGKILVIVEEGIIAELKDAAEAEVEPEAAVEAEPELAEPTAVKKVIESVSKEIHFSEEQTSLIKEMFVEFKAEILKELKPAEVELAVEDPIVMPIKASPEAAVAKKTINFQPNKARTVQSTVYEKMANFGKN